MDKESAVEDIQSQENLEQYQEELLNSITQKHESLQYSLKRLQEYTNLQFEQQKSKILTKLATNSLKSEEQLINQGLIFTDSINHLQEKIGNVLHYKQFMYDICNDMIKHSKLDGDELKIARDNFNLVCNYSKRKDEKILSEELYTSPLVKYLVTKTFKKSSTDVYNLVSSYSIDSYLPQKSDKDIKIQLGCIGGGPGSDLTGLLTRLIEQGFQNFECTIYDYNYKEFSKHCKEELEKSLKKYSKSVFKIPNLQISINWKFCDMKQTWEEQQQEIPKADMFTICWAINESLFNLKFWESLIQQNKNSSFFFIDGDRFPLEHVAKASFTTERKHIYELFETPRRLSIFPQEQ